ncbi:Release factor glutamine methyltransferase [bioreactor metagenome]|uniref:peptide chain release factor N(5)-glutamine methyltransferase n=1 Tax=bioreactor metagenome TaxID=1076179 RepID=A0A644Y5S8_9ZZZZ
MVKAILEAAGTPSAAFEARQLEKAGLGEEAARRRAAGEPLQYILGEWDFYGRTFLCREGVLIPRPETELLAEAALFYLDGESTAADLGCGTGCIGLTLAAEKGCAVTLIDIAPEPLALAQENAKKLGITNAFVQYGSIFEGPGAQKWDVIVSNPPYIKTGDLEALQPEVRREPTLALDGGEDGLDFYRAIAALWAPAAKRALLLEVGAGEAEDVATLLQGQGTVRTLKDYAGIPRIVALVK